jgi:type VI secretion system protein ImpA
VMVESGHHAVATPILEELLQHVDAHKLDEWEAGEVVARPFALLYRCLEQSGDDAARRQELYLRICRLDPLQAMQLADGTSAAP